MLKNNIKIFENDEIEKIKIISTVKSLVNNNAILENINSLQKDNFKSGKNPELKIFNNIN